MCVCIHTSRLFSSHFRPHLSFLCFLSLPTLLSFSPHLRYRFRPVIFLLSPSYPSLSIALFLCPFLAPRKERQRNTKTQQLATPIKLSGCRRAVRASGSRRHDKDFGQFAHKVKSVSVRNPSGMTLKQTVLSLRITLYFKMNRC